jgi:hypothetical protein
VKPSAAALLLIWIQLSTGHTDARADCPPAGYDKAQLQALRQQQFAIPDASRRNALAIELLDCTSSPDPELRDGVAFEGLSTWLRAEALANETIEHLFTGLRDQLAGPDDPGGFRKPFAALILSEVARTDRVEPRFSSERRAELVSIAAGYLEGVDDYRGFSEQEGWRHGVAHGADLALQLVLNEQIDTEQVRDLLAAIARQVAPTGAVFYRYGEPDRLARVVFYAHRRNDMDRAAWSSWLQGVTAPSPFEAWSEVYSSQAGLARRHNTLAFLSALLVRAFAADDPQGQELADLVIEAIRRVHG